MALHQWPYRVPFELRSAIARPDGPVAIRIHGPDLLERAGAGGHLDFRSFRIGDRNLFYGHWGADTVERETAVQFVPDPDFDPVRNPRGTLWFHLFKYSWEDRAFPRSFWLYFDTVNGGGKPSWSGVAEPRREPVSLWEVGPGQLEWSRRGDAVLGFQLPWTGKPSFHPLTTPSGKVLTADRPRDHIWHHGLCIGWTHVSCEPKGLAEYVFWGEPGGAVLHHSDARNKFCGPVASGFETVSICCTQAGEPVFDMVLRGTYLPVDVGWDWLDLEMTLVAREEAVTFSSEYGHLKARASMDFQDPVIVDSSGAARAATEDGKAVDWIGLSGKLEGAAAGLLLLNHPANPGGQPRGDGRMERLDQFSMDQGALFAWIGLNPMKFAPVRLLPGHPLTWRYRVVTTDRLLHPEFCAFHHQHWITPWDIGGLP